MIYAMRIYIVGSHLCNEKNNLKIIRLTEN